MRLFSLGEVILKLFLLLPGSTLLGRNLIRRFQQMKHIKAQQIWSEWLGLEALPCGLSHPPPSRYTPHLKLCRLQFESLCPWEKKQDELGRGRIKIKLWTAGAAGDQQDFRDKQSGSIFCLGIVNSSKQHWHEPWRAGTEERQLQNWGQKWMGNMGKNDMRAQRCTLW